jgi:hypothetical protein
MQAARWGATWLGSLSADECKNLHARMNARLVCLHASRWYVLPFEQHAYIFKCSFAHTNPHVTLWRPEQEGKRAGRRTHGGHVLFAKACGDPAQRIASHVGVDSKRMHSQFRSEFQPRSSAESTYAYTYIYRDHPHTHTYIHTYRGTQCLHSPTHSFGEHGIYIHLGEHGIHILRIRFSSNTVNKSAHTYMHACMHAYIHNTPRKHTNGTHSTRHTLSARSAVIARIADTLPAGDAPRIAPGTITPERGRVHGACAVALPVQT